MPAIPTNKKQNWLRQFFSAFGRWYKYLFFLYSIIYWPLVVIDDWTFVDRYWSDHKWEYLTIWFLWYLAYLIYFSVIFFILAVAVYFIRLKFFKSKSETD